ncbi:MAG: hypothetical protein ACI9ZT_001245 [Gammaproteobacteria bacterium]|jgi:hypothetical protein
MSFKKIQLVFILGLLALGLAACGGDDGDAGSNSMSSDSSDKPMAMAADGTLADYNPDHPSMVVEDNGVVHQEAIYKAWPQ